MLETIFQIVRVWFHGTITNVRRFSLSDLPVASGSFPALVLASHSTRNPYANTGSCQYPTY